MPFCKTGSPDTGLMWHGTVKPRLGFPGISSPAFVCCFFVRSRPHWAGKIPAGSGWHNILCAHIRQEQGNLFHPRDERMALRSNWTNLGLTSLPEPMTVARGMPGADWIPEPSTGKSYAYHVGSTNQDPHWS